MTMSNIIGATAFSLTKFPFLNETIIKSDLDFEEITQEIIRNQRVNTIYGKPINENTYDIRTLTYNFFPYGRNVFLGHVLSGVISAITAFSKTKDRRTCEKIKQATFAGCTAFVGGYISTFLFMEISRVAFEALGLAYMVRAIHPVLAITALSALVAKYRKQDLPFLFTMLVAGGLANSHANSISVILALQLKALFSAGWGLGLSENGRIILDQLGENGKTIFKQLKEWPIKRLNQLNNRA